MRGREETLIALASPPASFPDSSRRTPETMPDASAPASLTCHCVALRRSARRVTQFYDRHLAGSGLRITQYSLLRALAAQGPTAMQALAAHLVMDRTTLTRGLRPLEREGLVRLEAGRDARTRLVGLTEAGRARLEAATPAWARAQADFEAGFGVPETRTLRDLADRVTDAVA